MTDRVPRWVALGLLALAVPVTVWGADQLRLARADEMDPVFRLCGGLMLLTAALLFGGAGARLTAVPRLWRESPLLLRARFWAWLFAGGLLSYLALGTAFTGQDGARF